MAKDKEKLKRLKKEQKERTQANKQNGKYEPQRAVQPPKAVPSTSLRDPEQEQRIFELASFAPANKSKIEKNWTPTNRFERDMEKGVTAYRNWKYMEAAKEFLALLDQYPEQGMLYYYIANSFSYMFGEGYAIRFFQKALEYADNLEIWLDYGNILRVLGQTEDAIRVLETAREKFPKDGAPALLLASTYPDAKRKTAARDESLHKKCLKFNTIFREWESDNQLLKPQMEDFV